MLSFGICSRGIAGHLREARDGPRNEQGPIFSRWNWSTPEFRMVVAKCNQQNHTSRVAHVVDPSSLGPGWATLNHPIPKIDENVRCVR